jgi:UDP-glucuronate decarboxylase
MASPASPVDYVLYPIETLMVGSFGAKNLLDLALNYGSKILMASTSEVYGDPLEHPQKEDYWGRVNPIGIRACYDEGKRAAETLFFDYHRQHKVDIRVARIFNTYGPRMSQSDGRVVSNFITQALRGDSITIYGDGTQTRSFCYVDDLISGITSLFFKDGLTGPINLGNPAPVTMLELAEEIKGLIGSRSSIRFEPLPGDDPREREPDITLAKEKLGWEPTIGRKAGLINTIEYFREVIRP